MATIHTMEKGSIESRKDFKKNPSDQYKYWLRELDSSEVQLRQFRTIGTKVVNRFTGYAKGSKDSRQPDERGSMFRLNLFHSNTVTLQSMLYVDLPEVIVTRRFHDPNDDVGRVAAMIMERLLNNDIQENGKELECALKASLQDRLLPGLGVCRVRYDVKEDVDEQGQPRVLNEDAPVDYYHWRDVAWGWGRSFADLPWIGFRTFLTKDKVRERFGEEAADKVHLKKESTVPNPQEEPNDADEDSPWRKAEVWEIWDKERREIVWLSPGYDRVLDTKPDPLGLSGFYPCPPFLLANQTTSLYVPTSDFYIAQDLYNEIDTLQTRISIITEAVKVVGVYNRESEGIGRMFKEGTDNDLIPVDNWALFAEKGGIEGQIDWVPIGEITEALLRLRELRDEAIGLLQQVTGMADIMRGELGGQYEGVGQTEMRAKFGSVRIQALQDELAKFASDLMQIKAEIISRHFDAESIVARANLDSSYDMELVPQAIQLIKQPEFARLRVKVRPESVGMADYAQLKMERTEYISSVASFLQGVGPMIESEPTSKPYLLELLKWGLAGFKGSNDIEAVIDRAIDASIKQLSDPNQQKPNEEQAKAQGQMQLEQMKHQFAMEQLKAKTQADMAVNQQEAQLKAQETQMDFQAEMQKMMGELQATLAEINAKMVADIKAEQVTSQVNAQQSMVEASAEVQKSHATTQMDMAKAEHQTQLHVAEAEHQAEMDIKVEKAKPKPTAKPSPAK